MSARDYLLYDSFLPALVGRKSFLTLATNSIKLHIDQNKKAGTYLWIDPPWAFVKTVLWIESSQSCPDYQRPDYRRRFKDWCARFSPISASEIVNIEANPSGRLLIEFHDSYRLVIPAAWYDDEAHPSWYDHWYYTDANRRRSPVTRRGRNRRDRYLEHSRNLPSLKLLPGRR
jgi:hypothetical protein